MVPVAIKMETKLLTSQVSSLYPPSALLHFQTLHSWWGAEASSHLTKAMHFHCHTLYVVRLPCNTGIQLTSQACLQSPLEGEWLTSQTADGATRPHLPIVRKGQTPLSHRTGPAPQQTPTEHPLHIRHRAWPKRSKMRDARSYSDGRQCTNRH